MLHPPAGVPQAFQLLRDLQKVGKFGFDDVNVVASRLLLSGAQVLRQEFLVDWHVRRQGWLLHFDYIIDMINNVGQIFLLESFRHHQPDVLPSLLLLLVSGS